MSRTPGKCALLVLALTLVATACSSDGDETLTVYSGRKEEIVAPLLAQFEEETGIDLEIRYADSVDLAATLREEGDSTPADVFFAVDPASLGAVAEAGLLAELPGDILEMVPSRFSDRAGRWVGTSGRARVVVYDTSLIAASDLPSDVTGFADPAWDGRFAIAPTNGSFLAFVAAMILVDGEKATADWLDAIAANHPGTYPKNSVIVTAVAGGEIEAGLVNHYYLFRHEAEAGDTTAENHFFAEGPGALVMPAGAGITTASANRDAAETLVRFLLSVDAQQFFVEQTFEYPMIEGLEPAASLPDLGSLATPDIDLSDLAGMLDLATDLVAEAGLL